MSTHRHPVVVLGAGPVGLTGALALRAAELPVVVLEAEGEGRERPGSRAIFLHRQSLEHLEAISDGLGRALADHGLVWSTKRTFWGEHQVYERTYEPPDPRTLPHSTNLSQVVIEQLLLEACRRNGVEFAWEQEVTAVRTSGSGVELDAANGDTWVADHVLAGDGAWSVARAGIGAELDGERSATSFVIVDVAEDEDRPLRPERRFYYEHPAVGGRNVLLVPFAGGWRADLQLRIDDDPEAWNDTDGVRRWIVRVLPEAYADRVTWVSTYQFLQVVADRFTDDHRKVLLAGEAAHLFAPFGARGLNSGIVDARSAADAIATGTREAVDEFAASRREAALYNRDASSQALAHMQANGLMLRLRRRLAVRRARKGTKAGTWLDSSPFGPRAGEGRSPDAIY